MNERRENIKAMANSIALMLAKEITLNDTDSLNIYSLKPDIAVKIAESIQLEYLNDIDISPSLVRVVGADKAYRVACVEHFDSTLSDSCEQWIRRIQIEDAK